MDFRRKKAVTEFTPMLENVKNISRDLNESFHVLFGSNFVLVTEAN